MCYFHAGALLVGLILSSNFVLRSALALGHAILFPDNAETVVDASSESKAYELITVEVRPHSSYSANKHSGSSRKLEATYLTL